MKSWPAWMALLLSSCASAVITDHVADGSYNGEPRRMFVGDAIDPDWNSRAPEAFKRSISDALSRCGVAVEVYSPPAKLALNQSRNVAEQIAAFKPDSVLGMRQTRRTSHGSEVISGAYVVTLFIPGLKREVWKAELELIGSLSGQERAAADLGRRIVNEMSKDGVLRSCPPPAS